ncbi:MAG: IS1380 family transposase [Spirochaetales bacterium]|nr:MAG: IS1380 family transposase [Spirochaetales bacterium]
MSARIDVMAKSPFVLDTNPLPEASSPHAGVLATSRAFRSLGYPALIDSHLSLYRRKRGLREAQMIESVVLLQTIGGDCPEDIGLLVEDRCLERGLGYRPPKVTTLREFLELFDEPQLEGLRPPRSEQLSFIVPESDSVKGLQQVQAGGVANIAALYEKHGMVQRIATIDQDATIIESHKRAAFAHYQGGRGYQPMIAMWAEADLIVADQFRDGNVPAGQAPLDCCRMAFEALPASVNERYFRGDSACYETQLLQWLSAKEREREAGGRIGFAISADMTPELAKVVRETAEEDWKTFDTEMDGTRRQWAELDFVPSQRVEHKDQWPLRYVGLRLLKPQGSLFADGSDREHFAVVTNLDWDGGRLITWHREKAGTIEHVHDELKNGLAASHMPSQRFAVNATWLKLSILSYNIASAIKGLCLVPDERTARFKRYRLLTVHIAGRMNRNNCVMGLRLCASEQTIARLSAVWEMFELSTQATSSRPLARAG